MNKSAQQKNAELTLRSIQEDTITASTRLSEILDEQVRALEALGTSHAELQGHDAQRADLLDKHLALSQRQKEMENEKNRHLNELAIITAQKKAAAKELSQLNNWIATAETELIAKREESKKHDQKVTEKQTLQAALDNLQESCAYEEQKRDAIRLETSLMLEDTNENVRGTLERARRAKEEAAEAETRRDEAENDRQHIIQESTRISADLEIWIRRVEAKVGKELPELRMIL